MENGNKKKLSLGAKIALPLALLAAISAVVFLPLSPEGGWFMGSLKNLFGGKATVEKQMANPEDVTKSYSDLFDQTKESASFETMPLFSSELDMMIYKAKKDGDLFTAHRLENIKIQSELTAKANQDPNVINKLKAEVDAAKALTGSLATTNSVYVSRIPGTGSEVVLSLNLTSSADTAIQNFTIYCEAYKDGSLKPSDTQVYINDVKKDFEFTQDGGFLTIKLNEPVTVTKDALIPVSIKEISKGISGIKGYIWNIEMPAGTDMVLN